MPRPYYHYGRFVTVALFGLVVALAFVIRSGKPMLSTAAGATPAGATPPGATPPGATPSGATPAASATDVKPDAESENEPTDGNDTLDLTGLQEKFQAIAKRVGPTVVAISAAETADGSDSALRAEEMTTQKLEELLAKTTRTVGTGFVISADGYILTNEHVIEDSQEYWVTTDDHHVYPAIVVGADPRADLAVLKIPAQNLPTVKFSRNASARGQWTITLGNPYGLATEGDMAMSVGVVSATDRSLPRLASKENRLYSNLIQTTAQINPGNSGGPLFDVNGQVIGINTAVILPQKQTNGIGFAIPVTQQLLSEVDDLRQGREVVYGYIGVTVSAPTDLQRHVLNIVDPIGVHVDAVETGSPATGNLKPDDIVLQVNGQTVRDSDHFVRLIGSAALDKPSSLLIARDDLRMMVSVTPIKRPVQFAIFTDNQRLYWRGMILGPVPANWSGADHLAKPVTGVLVVDIDKDSPMHKQKIAAGSIIATVAGRPVGSLLDLQNIVNDVTPDQCDVKLADTKAVVATVQK
jgi:serine protease Do